MEVPISIVLVVLIIIAVVAVLAYYFLSSAGRSPVPPVSFALGGLTYALSDNTFVIPFRAALSPESPPIVICRMEIEYIDSSNTVRKAEASFVSGTSYINVAPLTTGGSVRVVPSVVINQPAVDMALEVSISSTSRAEPQSIMFYLCRYGETTPRWSEILFIPGTNIKP